jgi:aminoglycoside phosphotransferase family enzyme
MHGSTEPPLEAKVEFLSRPDAYPDRPERVDVLETHMSWVFLTDRHVYKLKKPIKYDVLDFSRLALRHRSCEGELRLNRRLAEHVYQDVIPLAMSADGSMALSGTGVVVDWLVKMQRLPAERMLDRAIAENTAERDQVERAATLLAEFYLHAQPASIDGASHRQHLREGVDADRSELVKPFYRLPTDDVHRVAQAQLRCLDEARPMFDQRVHEGRVVEGHGDLRPEHICLTDPPVIIDCLEFSQELLILDPADELSFLSLECRRLGAPQVGDWVMGTYRRVTGDDPPTELLDFYVRYRALRRAKIAIWHLRDPELDGRQKWRERAEWYIAEAVGSLPPAEPSPTSR